MPFYLVIKLLKFYNFVSFTCEITESNCLSCNTALTHRKLIGTDCKCLEGYYDD